MKINLISLWKQPSNKTNSKQTIGSVTDWFTGNFIKSLKLYLKQTQTALAKSETLSLLPLLLFIVKA